MLHLDATISALVYAVLREYCPRTDHSRYFPNNRVVQFVKEQSQRMPDFARFGLAIMTLCLDASGIILAGKPFHRLEQQSRLKTMALWKAVPYSVPFDIIRFYELFSIFGWYADKERKSSEAKSESDQPHGEHTVFTSIDFIHAEL